MYVGMVRVIDIMTACTAQPTGNAGRGRSVQGCIAILGQTSAAGVGRCGRHALKAGKPGALSIVGCTVVVESPEGLAVRVNGYPAVIAPAAPATHHLNAMRCETITYQ